MTCATCVNRIEKGLNKLDGILEAKVNLSSEEAYLTFDQDKINQDAIIKKVTKLEFQASLYTPTQTRADYLKNKNVELKIQKIQLITAATLSLPLVLPMILMPFGVHWMLSGWIQLVLCLPVQFYLGRHFYIAAWKALKNFSGNMELLITIGTTAAFLLSLFNLFTSSSVHELYFESSSVLITLVMLGKFFEAKAKLQTTSALNDLYKLWPQTASLIKDGVITIVPLEQIRVSDQVIVKAGERIPVDGIIIEGLTQVDESLISGESIPKIKKENSSVVTGSINLDGVITIETKKIGKDTVLAQIIDMVEHAQAEKAPIQKLVDKVSNIFVPIIILISIITFLIWGLSTGNWNQALINAISVLVISCPCALGLATPTAIIVGTGLGARYGIIIKDAESLETTHSLKAIAFDKTGTLTSGKPQVKKVISLNTEDTELIKYASSLAQASEHPLSKSLVSLAQKSELELFSFTDIKVHPGKGIEGMVNGNRVILGSRRLLENLPQAQNELSKILHKLEGVNETTSFVLIDSTPLRIGAFTFVDSIKIHAQETIKELEGMGIKSIMITGDNELSAKHVAKELGIEEFYSNVLPQDKLKIIEELKNKYSCVGMVGDGINDAPALASAHVGIAMSTGTDVAIHTAGVTLMNGDPSLIASAISLSKKTYRKIQENLFWALVYNAIGIPLAALGYLSPVIAGTAMAFSSVSVVSNALLLKRWAPKKG